MIEKENQKNFRRIDSEFNYTRDDTDGKGVLINEHTPLVVSSNLKNIKQKFIKKIETREIGTEFNYLGDDYIGPRVTINGAGCNGGCANSCHSGCTNCTGSCSSCSGGCSGCTGSCVTSCSITSADEVRNVSMSSDISSHIIKEKRKYGFVDKLSPIFLNLRNSLLKFFFPDEFINDTEIITENNMDKEGGDKTNEN